MTITDLSCYRIPGSNEAFYIPEFVTHSEEEYLIRKINESPQQKWKQLANRRLQLLGGELTAKNTLVPQAIPAYLTSYPDIIPRIKSTGAFKASPHGAPNHVILNEYLPGQGIMPHQDGPAYHPVVTTISVGSHAVFHYFQYKETQSESPETPDGRVIDPKPLLSVLLEPRSAIITTGALYASHLHGIEDLEQDVVIAGSPPTFLSSGTEIANWNLVSSHTMKDLMRQGGALERETRYSLTCRDVAKVFNAGGLLKR
ncbi:hypothetical protein C8J56DRAFT_980513 [Mycena floridula]|nr:hypothetical protein C8J56DRAFT_980513 [Mycena floridula]